MFHFLKFLALSILPGLLFISCSSHTMPSGSSSSGSKSADVGLPGPPCIVYKTRNDYNHLVPVILTPDKSAIASYPGIRDVSSGNGFLYPTLLANGYLLDNRGIGPDVAFISYTYEEYSKLTETPDSKELYKLIVDKEPLLEMYNCGNKNKYNDLVKTLNDIILKEELHQFTRLK